jgi:hypothetical protein
MQEIKVKEQKERAASSAGEKKTKAQQEAVLKKREIARKKEEGAIAKADAKAAAKAAKEKEKLRRARRGPGMAMVESFALRTISGDACVPYLSAHNAPHAWCDTSQSRHQIQYAAISMWRTLRQRL